MIESNQSGSETSWFDRLSRERTTGNDNACRYSTVTSTQCKTEMDEESGVPVRKCERILRRLRHCPGSAPEEVQCDREESIEPLPTGPASRRIPTPSNDSSGIFSHNDPLGSLFGGEGFFQRPNPAEGSGAGMNAPFRQAMGGVLGDLLVGMRTLDELTQALEHSFRDVLDRQGVVNPGTDSPSHSTPGSVPQPNPLEHFFSQSQGVDGRFPQSFARGGNFQENNKEKFDEFSKDFTEV
mmetsp:Transcript_22665/g.31616  ORF Transcript_22665/g.31616 Transcript_22665/m.31616 type:complete len:239 (+) Transcript_22665:113-829(+)|eukprot:CAMPEP_0196579836 /NCGR_PEP_ID=MMETSP1081-20130531/25083_1 /TAXON_ID=36882 /ORGANISM="Pyramimonas amylifera, Strain CCMP720" /LENGTH=238 /DNA_ID=CAMNT_0041899535 /DNA_START=112 /DNA_END=828 /DNA_ORIENTATION=+